MQKLDTLQKYLVVSLVTRYFFGIHQIVIFFDDD